MLGWLGAECALHTDGRRVCHTPRGSDFPRGAWCIAIGLRALLLQGALTVPFGGDLRGMDAYISKHGWIGGER
jgi:hypothetical protein